MKIVCISDSHGSHYSLPHPPYGDLLIHSGDFSSYGQENDTKDFLRWLGGLHYKYKILVAGNHDKLPFENPRLFSVLLKDICPGVHYLEDSEVNVGGLTVWGAPWTPTFMQWYFMADRGSAIKYHWDKIPNNIDVLVTHGPPFGFLDKSRNWNNATGERWDDHLGCRDLQEAMYRVRPLLHTFGHIHGSGGHEVNYTDDDGHKTILVNASLMDEAYQMTHKPVVIDL